MARSLRQINNREATVKVKIVDTDVHPFLQSLGFSPPLFWAYLAGIAEFGGGLCVLLGFLTRLAALVLAIAFVMFMVKVKWTRGFRMSQDAWAWYWALLAMVLSLLVIGPGRLALDHQIPTGL